MKFRSLMFLVAGAGLAWTGAQADAPSRPLVIELFTAQGCSSCPPADEFLGQLSDRSDVIALAYHMDYWDSSGWRDRFELRDGVDRQKDYQHNFRLPSVFTPQFVLDGQKNTMDPKAIVQAIQEPRDTVPVTLAVQDGQVVVDVGEKQGAHASDVMLVSYLRHATSNPGRGENAGKTLEEYNIVRSIHRLGEWKGASANYKVSADSLPKDATDVAVLVQTKGTGPIVGAAAHPLH